MGEWAARDPQTGDALTTRGEALLGRRLARETRAGVEHYATGQLVAMVDRAPDLTDVLVGFVSYVGPMGDARLVMYDYGESERSRGHDGAKIPKRWRPHVMLRAGLYTGPTQQPIDADNSPTPIAHVEALEQARKNARGL